MMAKKEDLRIVKTKRSLIKAFYNLLQETSLDNITVNIICEKADIRRATFYKHFKDKLDFYTFIMKSFRDDFDSTRIDTDKSTPITEAYYVEYATELLNYFVKHGDAMNKILESSMCALVIDIFVSQNYIDTKKRLEMSVENGVRLPASVDTVTNMLVGGISHIIVAWFKSEDKIPIQTLIDEITCIIERIFRK